ncbi:MAG TPA: hypothetical protein VLF66_00290 [Thermoanaerobaculia bacterium]|nr:hypothetical protein [Thermoanaerobaculia bacterium]
MAHVRRAAPTAAASAFGVSHSREDESLEAKARWFQSLALEERMAYLCELTELALQNDPHIAEAKDAPATPGRVRVLELP